MLKRFNDVRARSLIHLNEPYVLNGLYMNDTSLEAITLRLIQSAGAVEFTDCFFAEG